MIDYIHHYFQIETTRCHGGTALCQRLLCTPWQRKTERVVNLAKFFRVPCRTHHYPENAGRHRFATSGSTT
jgi:hypothetical protein